MIIPFKPNTQGDYHLAGFSTERKKGLLVLSGVIYLCVLVLKGTSLIPST